MLSSCLFSLAFVTRILLGATIVAVSAYRINLNDCRRGTHPIDDTARPFTGSSDEAACEQNLYYLYPIEDGAA